MHMHGLSVRRIFHSPWINAQDIAPEEQNQIGYIALAEFCLAGLLVLVGNTYL